MRLSNFTSSNARLSLGVEVKMPRLVAEAFFDALELILLLGCS